MVNYKEILRLNHEGYSQRQIESSVHCSRHIVRDVLAVAEIHNLTWPLDKSITNEQIEAILFRRGIPQRVCIWNQTTHTFNGSLLNVVLH